METENENDENLHMSVDEPLKELVSPSRKKRRR